MVKNYIPKRGDIVWLNFDPKLDFPKTSLTSVLTSRDKVLDFSENNVPIGTLLEEKPIDCSGGEPEAAEVLGRSSNKGHEQAGLRPALVLSPEKYNLKSDLMIACPITSKVKNYPFEVPVSAKKIKGSILADQVRNIDWKTRKATYIESVPASSLNQTQELITLLITG